MPFPFLPSQLQTTLFIWSVFAHVVADWLFQTNWMARYKSNLRHPAGWVHGGIHTLCYLIFLPWHLALLVGIVHILIDTRVPLYWWMRVIKGVDTDSPHFKEIIIWMDQMLHVTVLAIVILVFV